MPDLIKFVIYPRPTGPQDGPIAWVASPAPFDAALWPAITQPLCSVPPNRVRARAAWHPGVLHWKAGQFAVPLSPTPFITELLPPDRVRARPSALPLGDFEALPVFPTLPPPPPEFDASLWGGIEELSRSERIRPFPAREIMFETQPQDAELIAPVLDQIASWRPGPEGLLRSFRSIARRGVGLEHQTQPQDAELIPPVLEKIATWWPGSEQLLRSVLPGRRPGLEGRHKTQPQDTQPLRFVLDQIASWLPSWEQLLRSQRTEKRPPTRLWVPDSEDVAWIFSNLPGAGPFDPAVMAAIELLVRGVRLNKLAVPFPMSGDRSDPTWFASLPPAPPEFDPVNAAAVWAWQASGFRTAGGPPLDLWRQQWFQAWPPWRGVVSRRLLGLLLTGR